MNSGLYKDEGNALNLDIRSARVTNERIKSIFVTTIEEALKVKDECLVIFKGCSYRNGEKYPLAEILRIVEKRSTVIYESGDYVEFFTNCIM
jgi:hypothetical protein